MKELEERKTERRKEQRKDEEEGRGEGRQTGVGEGKTCGKMKGSQSDLAVRYQIPGKLCHGSGRTVKLLVFTSNLSNSTNISQ